MEDWKRNVMEAVRKPEALALKKGDKNKFILQGHAPPSFIYLLDKVLNTLDYAQSSYLRRSIAVQLSSHLGIPLSEIMQDTSQVRRRGTPLPRYPDPGYDDLTEIHLFCPHPGCDGSHFR